MLSCRSSVLCVKQNATSIIAFGFLWFFIAIGPRSSFIPSSELLTDYKTYLASLGVLLLLALGVVKLIALLFEEKRLPVVLQRYTFHCVHSYYYVFYVAVGFASMYAIRCGAREKNFGITLFKMHQGKRAPIIIMPLRFRKRAL